MGAAGLDPADAEDIAQEAFARTLRNWRRVRSGTNPAGYVATVAFRLAQRTVRWPAADLGIPQPDPGRSVEDTVAGRLEAAAVLDGLSPGQRAAAVLVWYLGFSAEEAAGVLHVEGSTVRKHLFRARRR